MIVLKKPPKIKVLEALSAVAGERVITTDEYTALVHSSDNTRTYNVKIVPLGNNKYKACSTDNGTVYRRYIGYPILAVFMKRGIIPYDEELAVALKDVPWRRLNEEYKKYSVVEETVKNKYLTPLLKSRVDLFINTVMRRLGEVKVFYDKELCPQ